MVDESLDAFPADLLSTPTARAEPANGSDRERPLQNMSHNVLSFYDAFVDPGAGYIHLVVEYMDGGSLQDIVLRGGCRDEDVLADIAFQVLSVRLFITEGGKLCSHRPKSTNYIT